MHLFTHWVTAQATAWAQQQPGLQILTWSRWYLRPQTVSHPCMATGTTNINTDSDYDRAIDSDTAPGQSLGPDFTMGLGGSADHPSLYGSDSNMTFRHQHGLRC